MSVRVGDTGEPELALLGSARSNLETFFIHAGGGLQALKSLESNDRRIWAAPSTCYSGVPHKTANKKKKAARKRAQASRRKNRR